MLKKKKKRKIEETPHHLPATHNSSTLPGPQPPETTSLLSVSVDLSVLDISHNGIIGYVAFHDWLLSLSIMFERFIHVVAHITASFLFRTEYYSTARGIPYFRYPSLCALHLHLQHRTGSDGNEGHRGAPNSFLADSHSWETWTIVGALNVWIPFSGSLKILLCPQTNSQCRAIWQQGDLHLLAVISEETLLQKEVSPSGTWSPLVL